MPYDYPAIRRHIHAARAGTVHSGPWKPHAGWYSLPSWRVWKRFSSVSVTITEELSESEVVASPDSLTVPDLNVTESKTQQWHTFTAEVPFASFWRGDPADRPAGLSLWRHDSRLAYGPGLYDATGQLILYGTSITRTRNSQIFRPWDGPEDESVLNDTTVTHDNAHVSMEYDSDETALHGLATFCRMVVQQTLHATAGGIASSGTVRLYDPPERDPDGIPGAEVYFTDTTLAALAAGSWNAEMVLRNGAVSEEYGPDGYWRKFFSRSGTLALTVG